MSKIPLDSILSVRHAMSTCSTRPRLNGVLVDPEAGLVVASDGYRMATHPVCARGLSGRVILSREAVDAAYHLRHNHPTLRVGPETTTLEVIGRSLSFRNVEAVYPSYELAIPLRLEGDPFIAVLAERGLLAILRRAAGKGRDLRLRHVGGALELGAGSEPHTVYLSRWTRRRLPPVQISAQFLLDVFREMPENQEVIMSWKGKGEPVLLTSADCALRGVVMPVVK